MVNWNTHRMPLPPQPVLLTPSIPHIGRELVRMALFKSATQMLVLRLGITDLIEVAENTARGLIQGHAPAAVVARLASMK